MEKRTSEIIMTLKGNHEFGERDTYKQLLAAYMSDRCDYPEDQYTDEMLFGIVKETVKDYLSGCSGPGYIRAFLDNYFEAHKWHEDELSQWLSALAQVQVREKNGDGTYRYINGFDDENTSNVCKTKENLVNPTEAHTSPDAKPASDIVVKYYCPLVISYEGSDYYHTVDSHEAAVCYYCEILKALEAYDDGDMAEYYDGPESAKEKLLDVSWGVEVVNCTLYGCITAKLKSPFTVAEEANFKDWIEGQNSDGFGECFEQQEIKVDDGWLTVSFWHNGDDYFILNDKEFANRKNKKK